MTEGEKIVCEGGMLGRLRGKEDVRMTRGREKMEGLAELIKLRSHERFYVSVAHFI